MICLCGAKWARARAQLRAYPVLRCPIYIKNTIIPVNEILLTDGFRYQKRSCLCSSSITMSINSLLLCWYVLLSRNRTCEQRTHVNRVFKIQNVSLLKCFLQQKTRDNAQLKYTLLFSWYQISYFSVIFIFLTELLSKYIYIIILSVNFVGIYASVRQREIQ